MAVLNTIGIDSEVRGCRPTVCFVLMECGVAGGGDLLIRSFCPIETFLPLNPAGRSLLRKLLSLGDDV